MLQYSVGKSTDVQPLEPVKSFRSQNKLFLLWKERYQIMIKTLYLIVQALAWIIAGSIGGMFMIGFLTLNFKLIVITAASIILAVFVIKKLDELSDYMTED